MKGDRLIEVAKATARIMESCEPGRVGFHDEIAALMVSEIYQFNRWEAIYLLALYMRYAPHLIDVKLLADRLIERSLAAADQDIIDDDSL